MSPTAPTKPRAPRRRPPAPPMVGVHIGPEGLPPLTLGWVALQWTADYLLHPSATKDNQIPWKYTAEQARFVLWWYALDERGRFAYRSGMLRRMKGWGKDPVGATLCGFEFVGPCRFDHWAGPGDPVGVEHPQAWVQTAAVSKDQTRNTMTLFPGLFSQRAIEEFEIDLGKEIIYAHRGRGRIEAVTSSPRALEGGRPTFTLKNETHHWLRSNEGHEMAAVIARNAAKAPGGASRVLAISNAHNPGEDSDAERDYAAYMKIASGKSRATGFLYDSLEAPATVEMSDPRSLIQGLIAARGDSHWLDAERLMEEIYDPRTLPSTARRFYLNQIIAAEDAWLSPQEWDVLKAEKPVEPGEQMTLGLDGSKSDDHTVLSGCRVSDGHLFLIEAWDPADQPSEEIDLERVDVEVQKAFANYDVVGFYSDRNQFTAYNAKWEQEHGETLCVRASQNRPIEWDMSNSKAAALAAQAYHDAIMEGMLSHSGAKRMDQYHYNARRRPTNYEGAVTFGKESAFSSRKVDGVASNVLAWKARQDYLALPENRKRQVTGPSVYEDRGLRRL